MGTCDLCGDKFPEEAGSVLDDLAAHIRVMHPDVWEQEGGMKTWPDGEYVVEDQTLEPKDFG